MLRRPLLLATTLLLACASAQSQTQQQRTTVELVVRVTYNDPRAKIENVRVQLSNLSGATLNEKFIDGGNQATFVVIPGNYKLKFTAVGIDPQETPTFQVLPNSQMHMETVVLRIAGEGEGVQQVAAGAPISAAELNIPGNARKEFEKGVKAMEQEDHAAAEKYFRKAVQIYPKYAMAYNNLGVLALKANDRAAGREAFTQAVEHGSSAGAVNLAKLASADRNPGDAEQLLSKALALNPMNAEALMLLAREQVALGKLDLAVVNARKVHELPHTALPMAHLIAGLALERQGQPTEAIAEYRRFLEESPASPSAGQVHRVISKLEARLAGLQAP